MKTICYTLLTVILLLSSCEKKNFADDILKMQSRPIDLTACNEAFCCENGERTTYNSEDSTYRLVVYLDSLSCSTCFISHMMDYLDTVEEFDSAGIKTIFLFEPKQGMEEDVISELSPYAYPFKIMVTKNGTFSSANSHLPSSSVMHSFLINKENNVMIVGNPDKNAIVRDLMLDIVKQ